MTHVETVRLDDVLVDDDTDGFKIGCGLNTVRVHELVDGRMTARGNGRALIVSGNSHAESTYEFVGSGVLGLSGSGDSMRPDEMRLARMAMSSISMGRSL